MPRKGNKGLQLTLSTVVSSAFETPEILSVSPSEQPPHDVSTSPEIPSFTSFATPNPTSAWATISTSSFTVTTPTSPSDDVILKRLDSYEKKLNKLDKYEEKFDLFVRRVKQQHDNMRDCFLQLKNKFFKKLENDEGATTKLQGNDKSLREQIAKEKFKFQEGIGSLLEEK
jgi:hypothetical protein